MVGTGVIGEDVDTPESVGISVLGAEVFICGEVGTGVLGADDTGTRVVGTGGLLLGAGVAVSSVGKGETGLFVAGPEVEGEGGIEDWSDRVQKLTSSDPISNSCINSSSCCWVLYLFICPFCLLRRNRDRAGFCSSTAVADVPAAERHAATIIADLRAIKLIIDTLDMMIPAA